MSLKVSESFPPQELFTLSENVGRRIPDWTQGAGGNISVKSKNSLWIKASGERLSDIAGPAERNRFARLDCVKFAQEFQILQQGIDRTKIKQSSVGFDPSGGLFEKEKKYSEMLKVFSDPEFGKASMETAFHIKLPQKYVLHFHALSFILIHELTSADPALMAQVQKLLRAKYQISCHWVDLFLPGFQLSLFLEVGAGDQIYILKNHGIILASDSETILSKFEVLEKDLLKELDVAWEFNQAVPENVGGPIKVFFPDFIIFKNEIKKHLKNSGDKKYFFSRPSPEATKEERGAFENWWATQKLFASNPHLAELSIDFQREVLGLPTEKERFNKSR